MPIVQTAVCALMFVCLFGFTFSNLENDIKVGLAEYAKTGVRNKAYREVVESMKFPHVLRSNYKRVLEPSLYCATCDGMADTVIAHRRNGNNSKNLAAFMTKMCVNFNIETLEVCTGYVAMNLKRILYIVDNNPSLTSKHICSVLLQGYGCVSDTAVEWSVKIPPPTVNVQIRPSFHNKIRIGHISDIHYDPLYLEGAVADCNRPICCHSDMGIPKHLSETAGRWGDYRNCDTPWHAIQDTLSQLRTHTDDQAINYIYMTGDILSHKVWATERRNNTLEISTILQTYFIEFNKMNITVFPVLGNHESHPVNVFVESPDPNISSQWLYDLSGVEWRAMLPEDTTGTILKGGYYTTLLKPGLRIIGLNSNVCYTSNYWLVQNEVDPFGQLAWLVQVLTEAEKAGEKVHILSHIPSGVCFKSWSRELRRIIDRFCGTIAAIFNGHTHKDEFNVFYKKDNINEACCVAYNGGSISAYSDVNPNYRIYDVDADTFEVLDIETWIYNLTKANLNPNIPPVWFKEYTFKQIYGLEQMRPQDMDQLVHKMATDLSLMNSYFRYYYKQADTSLARGCDDKCQLDMLCDIVLNEFGDLNKCKEITAIFKPR